MGDPLETCSDPPIAPLTETWCPFPVPGGSEDLRGGPHGPWEQLLAARDLTRATTRCHGCPAEATVCPRAGSGERVPVSCHLPETTPP